MRTGFLIRLFFVMLATTMFPTCLMAQWDGGRVLPTISSKLIGASIAADSFSISTYSPMGEDERKITNIISFYIREVDSARTFFASPFTATVNFDLELTINGQVSTQPAKTLVVNFDTTTGISYNVRAYIVLPEAASVVKLTVQNLTISGANGWNPSAVLQLDNDIQVSQYFHSLGPTTFSPGSFIAETETESLDRPDELKVSWMWPHEHYNLSQLEWAFIDSNMLDNYSYDLENPGNIFTNNGTRVDIDFGKETYQIPLLYPSGNLFFRVRPVLRKSNGNLITGPWSPAKLYAVNGHEGNLNWQSSTGFAENAKLKTVVQYFDGSLRNRQSVTKDNGSKNTVVAETIYDLQGRPNIQILPTPALANTIHYFKDFNRFVGQQPVGQGALSQYEDPAKYFDLSLVACAASPALDTTTGTGKYYSGNNDWLSIESKAAFIPNAHGYAYTETRFMDDASERVRSQGGVGPSHQLGSGHETKYWYGKPSQAELDALFGTEAGVASHYGKNMVQDPNQQLSVNYIDMQGRTVATALAGGTVAGMQDISNSSDYPKAGVIYDSLLTCETNIVKQRAVESVSTILVVAPNTKYDFVYELEPAMLRFLNCDSQQVCFDCKYDLEISIKSEACGDSLARIRRFNNLQPMQPFTCDSAVGFSGEGFANARRISFSDTLSIGSYIIRKTLTINDSIYELRRQDALSQFLCSTEQQLYDSIYASLQLAALCNDEQSANNTCDSCKTSVSNFAEYRTRYLSSLNISPANVDYDSAIRRYYISDSLECASACGNIRQELGSLQNYRQQLLDDMAAGSGQYGLPVSEIKRPGGTATDLSLAEAKYNIFSDTYILHGIPAMRVPYYLEPLLEDGRHYYLNIDDWPDSSVHGHISTGQQILDTVTAPTFTNLFQQQWSNSLVTRHPEYQLLQFAETYLRPAFEWLDKVEQCDTYQQAVDSGYLNPLNLANVQPYPSQRNDPFFILPGNTTAKAMMATRIFDGVVIDNNSYSGPSIWQLANATVLCSTKDSLEKPGCILSQLKDRLDPLITDPAEKNKAWEHFRTLYLGFRYDLVMSYITSRFPANKPDLDSLLHQGKQLRFATLRQLGQQHEWRNFSALLDGETASLAQLASVTDTTDRCKAQRPIWKAQLLQCESLVALLATGTSGDQIKVYNILNQILDGMELVCVNSTSPRHPYGASNVNPTFAGYPKNFEQVIHSVFANNGIDTAASTQYFCNAYSIGFPKPLELNPPLFANATNVIDTCACSQFVKLKQQANNLGFDTLTLTGTRSMNQFFREQFEDSISAIIWNGLQQCNKPLFKDTCFVVPGVDSTAVPVCQNCSPDTSVCGKPILYSVNYINTGSVNNVKLNIRTSSGTFNCKIIATNLVTNAITYFTIDSCGAFTDTISLPPLERYSIRLSVGSIHGLCYDSSDAHILSASRNVCKTMYTPIYMPEVIELPAFFSCDYKKPCLSCGSFQSYTQEFRQLFPAFSAVPYALSGAITAAQQEQNHLWARLINYRAGLNKTSAD
ncbi:MAG: DUF6443 domain-containing protein [Ferruginibacter sp.]|nr:DUF6443 domain-containing protein [Ferruginibacter sp.]